MPHACIDYVCTFPEDDIMRRIVSDGRVATNLAHQTYLNEKDVVDIKECLHAAASEILEKNNIIMRHGTALKHGLL